MASADGSTINEKPVFRVKVCVIGAGMAGLAAASLLSQNDIDDYVVLEARGRIGGRIVSIEQDGVNFELGANWIHGVLGNPMYELAMANNLVDIIHEPKPHRVVASTEQGKQVPFSMLQEVYEAYTCFLRRCEEYFLCQYLPPQGVESVGEHIELEIALYLDKVSDPTERRLKRLVFDCLLKREACISGCDSMNDVDLLELGSYTELQGGNIILPSGYSSILEPASRDIPKDKLLTRHAVSSIRLLSGDWRFDDGDSDSDNDSECTVIGSESNQPPVELENDATDETAAVPDSTVESDSSSLIEVVCSNSRTFLADHVICTIPLGVLKDHASTLFTPPLPQPKLEAIDKLLFGTVDKIFLVYDRPFLHSDITEIMLLWNQESSRSEDLSDNWHKKIYSFSKVTETVLLGWISGREADYMETLPEKTIADKCTELLRKFLNDPYVPTPKKCITTSWKSQPFTRGTYTALAVGASQCDIENLAQPLYCGTDYKPKLMFAGEHTHSSFYSTVHGAYLTGRACAQALVNCEHLADQITMSCQDTGDLSSWIRGISLDDYSV